MFLFDKVVIVCKRRGYSYELKEVIELLFHKMTDDPTNNKDVKKVGPGAAAGEGELSRGGCGGRWGLRGRGSCLGAAARAGAAGVEVSTDPDLVALRSEGAAFLLSPSRHCAFC